MMEKTERDNKELDLDEIKKKLFDYDISEDDSDHDELMEDYSNDDSDCLSPNNSIG